MLRGPRHFSQSDRCGASVRAGFGFLVSWLRCVSVDLRPAHGSRTFLVCSALLAVALRLVFLALAVRATTPPVPANLVPVRRRGDVVPTVILGGVESAPISVILICRTGLLMLVLMLLAQVPCRMFRLMLPWLGASLRRGRASTKLLPGLSLPVMGIGTSNTEVTQVSAPASAPVAVSSTQIGKSLRVDLPAPRCSGASSSTKPSFSSPQVSSLAAGTTEFGD